MMVTKFMKSAICALAMVVCIVLSSAIAQEQPEPPDIEAPQEQAEEVAEESTSNDEESEEQVSDDSEEPVKEDNSKADDFANLLASKIKAALQPLEQQIMALNTNIAAIQDTHKEEVAALKAKIAESESVREENASLRAQLKASEAARVAAEERATLKVSASKPLDTEEILAMIEARIKQMETRLEESLTNEIRETND